MSDLKIEQRDDIQFLVELKKKKNNHGIASDGSLW